MKRKRISAVLVMLFPVIILNAQWTTTGSNVYVNGNVGVRTTNPLYSLHSVSNSNSGMAAAYLWGQYYGTAVAVGNLSPSYYAFSVYGNFSDAGAALPGHKSLFYVRADGNVGVGTETLAEKFNVAGNLLLTDGGAPKIQILNRAVLQVPLAAETGYTRSVLGQNVSWNPSTNKWNIIDAVYPDFSMVRFENSGTLGFYTGYASSAELTNSELSAYKRIDIDNTGSVGMSGKLTVAGNVGIGTEAIPEHKLSVNGSAIFTKVKVKQYSNWPDYVFDNNYPLLPLRELSAFVKLNKHLPEIPDAEEVNRNGFDLADNQAALLKKIEELTLYIIRQQEEIDSLKKMKTEMEDLRKQIEGIKATQVKN